eukprot:GHVT01010181.1.p3 GENE.GHVT01010181.1~~GHVT01010181.1.p3  ORF type:complete len:132 (-),score=14.68 GHVT01010181.1:2409-2804(-)
MRAFVALEPIKMSRDLLVAGSEFKFENGPTQVPMKGVAENAGRWVPPNHRHEPWEVRRSQRRRVLMGEPRLRGNEDAAARPTRQVASHGSKFVRIGGERQRRGRPVTRQPTREAASSLPQRVSIPRRSASH